ncbi:MAG TPA: ABC transporter permease [Gemmatales bacterium]|nr:ABC transporter permease [Gemmatales bacterium]
MSNPNETASEHLQSSTPSRLANETPNWVRIVGLIGMVALAASLLMYCYNFYVYTQVMRGPSIAPGQSTQDKASIYPFVFFWYMLGVICMLVQASRERDKTQRRILGIIGASFFCLGVLFATNVLAGEAVKNLMSGGADQMAEAAAGKGWWAGLGATILMALVLLTAWIAPFVRSAEQGRVSLLGLAGSWVKNLGKPLVAACTMWGVIGLAVLTAIAFLLRAPLSNYSDMVLKYSADNLVPYGLGSYALLFMLTGLPFMLVLANTEEDEAWARMPTSILGVVGVIASFIGMIGFASKFSKYIVITDFALPYGFVLSLLGLFFCSLFISQRDDDSDTGLSVARWLSYAGLTVLIIAAVRSLIPSIVEIGWLQDTFPSLENFEIDSYLVPTGFVYMLLGGLYFFVGRLFCSESKLLIMTRRELTGFFTSPIGYIVLGATLVVAWYVFQEWVSTMADSNNMGDLVPEPVVLGYFLNYWIIIYILIAIPMLTMRLMSEENRAGTVEIMLTAPVDEFSIVMSKFLAGWLFTVLIFLSWAIYPVLLRISGTEAFDYRPLLSALFGLSLVAFGFVAMGLFFSSITKNQIVSLLLTFAVILGCFALYFIESMATAPVSRGGRGADPNTPLFLFLHYVSFINHLLTFAQGKVEFKQILFHLSFGAFWLFLTIRVLESRKWR